LPLGAQEELDQLIRRVDPDRWLTSRFIADQRARPDVLALYAYDYELARASKVASTPLLAEIRLTWWREALDEMFGARLVRRHPVAEALADVVQRRNLPRGPLEAMIDAQIEALEIELFDESAALAWADGVEGSVAGLAAKILEPSGDASAVAPAGRAWGLALLRRSGRAGEALTRLLLGVALDEARLAAGRLSVAAFPAALPARLAGLDLARLAPSVLAKRISLVLAAASGRL
jgi:phytoene synthase